MKKKTLSIIACTLIIATTFSVAIPPVEKNKIDTIVSMGGIDWWPQYGHDPAHTGYSLSTGPETNITFLDTVLINQGSTMSSALLVVSDTFLYLGGGSSGQTIALKCVNCFTGMTQWDAITGNNPTVYNGYIYAGNTSYLICFTNAGNIEWAFRCGGLSTAPTVVDDKIYFTSSDKKIYCVDTTGTQVWNASIDQYIANSIPAVVNNHVYFTSDITVFCYDALNGSRIWAYPKQSGGYAPTVVNNNVYVASGQNLLCLDAIGKGDGTTTLHWSAPFPSSVGDCAVAYGRVYVGAGSTMYSLNATMGDVQWSYQASSTVMPPAVADNKVYFGSGRTVLCIHAFNATNGTPPLIWSRNVPEIIARQPIIANGKVWMSARKYYVYGFGSNSPPEQPEKPSGPSQGAVGKKLTYISKTTDINAPAGDQIWYQWKFGVNETSWIGPVESGVPVEHTFTSNEQGVFNVKVKAKDFYEESSWSESLVVTIILNDPPTKPSTPIGPDSGITGAQYIFKTTATDPNNDQIRYGWDWNGDGQTDEWTALVNSGNEIQTPHTFTTAGLYSIQVVANDSHGTLGPWSDPLQVTIRVPKPVLSIESITAETNMVIAEIKNSGTADAVTVTWEITIKDGLVLFVKEANGTIDSLAIGTTKQVTLTGKKLLGIGIGLGKILPSPSIIVKVSAPNTDPVEDVRTATIFFKKITVMGG